MPRYHKIIGDYWGLLGQLIRNLTKHVILNQWFDGPPRHVAHNTKAKIYPPINKIPENQPTNPSTKTYYYYTFPSSLLRVSSETNTSLLWCLHFGRNLRPAALRCSHTLPRHQPTNVVVVRHLQVVPAALRIHLGRRLNHRT